MASSRAIDAGARAGEAVLIGPRSIEHLFDYVKAAGRRVVEGTDLPTDLELAVSGAPPAAVKDGPLPHGAVVISPSGEPTGFLDLWLKDGYLASVEHSWVTDEMPLEFPSPERLRPWGPEETHSERPPSN
jgi:hypothetical protein